MDQKRKDELLKRLDALMNMTVENGCSEHEAEIAATKAAKLMDEFGLSLDEIKRESPAGVVLESIGTESKKAGPITDLMYWISKLTHTTSFYGKMAYDSTGAYSLHPTVHITYVGMPADVAVARFLTRLFMTAIDLNYAEYWKAIRRFTDEHHFKVRSAFVAGMISKFKDRLRKLFREREPQEAQEERWEIIRLTDALIKKRLDQEDLIIRTNKNKGSSAAPYDPHYKAGQIAAEDVSISFGAIEE